MSSRIRDKISITAFKQSHEREQPDKGLVVHTDKVFQFSSKKFQKVLSKFEAISSMSAPGNQYDNAVIAA